jgi:uncharacterized protein
MSIRDRGFASQTLEERRRIAQKGGRAAHAQGRAHEWNTDTAREAGKKGGAAMAAKREHDRRTGSH